MTKAKLSRVQSSYDVLAEEYARRLFHELDQKPMDCELLDQFADSVRNEGVACDLGCGPGHVAQYLQNRGVNVRGMDLSEGMIACARRLNPGIDFTQGDMLDLPVEDESWAGVAAFYSIVNLEPGEVMLALREVMRVLKPGGRLLLSFHLGEDESKVEENLWNLGVSLRVTLFRLATIEGYIRAAGLTIDEIVERGPYAPDVEYQSRRAYIFADKPKAKNPA